MKRLIPSLSTLALASPLMAQSGGFATPGMPVRSSTGQTDRFSTEFNPAIGGVIDSLLSFLSADDSEDDGFQIALRSVEATLNTWVDPNTWAYVVLVGIPEEGVQVEEAAVIYNGFGGHSSLRAGRFFVDFGKQMQAHEHDLATFERPAVLRAFLGEELGGAGVQFDNWFTAGDSGAVRYSVGMFDSLLAESEAEIASETSEFKDIEELSYTARLTGFHDVGQRGVLQWGLSARGLPDFAFETELGDGSALDAVGLSNDVWGLDLTYGWTDDTGLKKWTFGGEYLTYRGDIAAEVDDAGTPADFSDDSLSIVDASRDGFYLWGDRQLNQFHSVGLLYSEFESPDLGSATESEVVAYYTRSLTEFSRLRFGVSYNDVEDGEDSTAFLVQFTNFFGSHAHGVNW